MRRRQFIGLLGGAAAWPLGLRAQQAVPVRRVGLLMARVESQEDPLVRVFQQAMMKLGWREHRDVEFEYRWAAGDIGRMQKFAKELVALHPDVIVGQSTQVVLALLRESRTLPIVFREVVDPVVTGLVPSLSHPGANVTGFTHLEPSIFGKYVEFLKEIAPDITCVAVLRNLATGTPNSEVFLHSYEQAASVLGLKLIDSRVDSIAELEASLAHLKQERNCGVIVSFQSFFTARLATVLELVARYQLPTIYGDRIYVERGGLASYGVDTSEVSRQVAAYVDQILRGGKPRDMPVQAPTKFELVINLKTAKALSLIIPPALLARADEVIE